MAIVISKPNNKYPGGEVQCPFCNAVSLYAPNEARIIVGPDFLVECPSCGRSYIDNDFGILARIKKALLGYR